MTSTMKKLLRILLLLALVASLFAAINIPGFLRARKYSQANRTLEDVRIISAAMHQYAIEFKRKPGDPVSWNDILPHIPSGTPLHSSEGKDILGNHYLIKQLDTLPKISPATYNALSDVAPKDFWSPYY